jgi:hypothetical protein
MWSFIVYLNDHLGSWPEYIAKVGQEQEEKDIPYDFDLYVEQQSDASRLPKAASRSPDNAVRRPKTP